MAIFGHLVWSYGKKQAMITLHGMAENRLTSVYFFINVFLGEIFFLYPLNFWYSFFFQGIFHDPLYGTKCCLINLEVKSKNTESHIYGQALHSLYDFCMTFLQTLRRVMA